MNQPVPLTNTDEDQNLDFASVLANSVHDMKNSIGMLLCSLEEVVAQVEATDKKSAHKLAQLQYEGQRVNYNLIQLLSIYKIDNAQYSANIGETDVEDFLQESVAQFESLLAPKGITIECECESGILGFIDQEMIAGVINNVINNAYRYSKDLIRLSAKMESGYLVISIADNGRGYPPTMLIDPATAQNHINFNTGSTGLGLYFATLVAQLHKNKGKRGYITCNNNGIDGGGCFSIYLP